MPTVGDALIHGQTALSDVADADALSEALMLLAHATGRQASALRLNTDDDVPANARSSFDAMIDQRARCQPISQIIGKRDFWKHEFIVTPDVLDPRPDTETLIEQALTFGPRKSVLDLGTGSGCILLSLLDEWQYAQGVGVDASSDALTVARRNADALELQDRASFQFGDWCYGLNQKFDMVVSNPPYITSEAMKTLSRDVLDWEPRMALTPEGDGLDAYRTIAGDVKSVMNEGAVILFEIGFDQGESVTEILVNHGFKSVSVVQDINGSDRVVHAQLEV